MTTKPSVQSMPREQAPGTYQEQNERRYRGQVDEELAFKHDKRSNLVLGRGKSLVLSSSGGVAFALSLSDAGIIVVTDVATGDVTTVTLEWGALANRPTNLVALTGAEGIVTINNTAAGITGQGALATLSAVTWATQVTGIGRPEDYATLSRVFRQDSAPSSPNANDIWVVTTGGGVTPISVRAWNGAAWVTGADITSINTAAAITGQGWGATAAEAAASNARVPTGANDIVNADMQRGMYGFVSGWDGDGGVVINRGINVFWTGPRNVVSAHTATPAAVGRLFDLVNTSAAEPFRIKCAAGQLVYGLARLAVYAVTGAVWLAFYNSSNSIVGYGLCGTGGRGGGGADNDPNNFDVVGGFATAPAGTAYAFLFVRAVVVTGSGFQGILATEFAAGIVSAGQTTLPVWSPGRQDPLGDQTTSNTAAAFVGQGIFATGNFYDQASDPGTVPNGSFWLNSGARILRLRSGGIWKLVATIGAELGISLAPGILESASSPMGPITGTASGGSGGYTYAWTYVSGDTFTVTAPTAASTTFSRGSAGSGVYRLTVTDSAASTAYQDAFVIRL